MNASAQANDQTMKCRRSSAPIGGYIRALALSPFVPQRLRVVAAKTARRDLETPTGVHRSRTSHPRDREDLRAG